MVEKAKNTEGVLEPQKMQGTTYSRCDMKSLNIQSNVLKINDYTVL